MKRMLFALLLSVACDRSPKTETTKATPWHSPRAAECLPADATTLEVYLDLLGDACTSLPKNLRSALKSAVFAESVDARAKILLDAARSDPRFRHECATTDDALAGRPMVEHPNLQACTHDAGFAADPWGTNTTILCQIDVGTYLFLDVVAAHLWADEGGPWLLEEPWKQNDPLRKVVENDAAQRRALRCDPTHPNVIAQHDRLKKASDEWNAQVASGDAGVTLFR